MSDITVNNPTASPVIVTEQNKNSITVNDNTTHQVVEVKGIFSGSGDKTYVHDQGSPDDVWKVEHNLNKKPSVTVTTYYGVVVYGNVEYIDNNNLKITFEAGAFSGKAFLN